MDKYNIPVFDNIDDLKALDWKRYDPQELMGAPGVYLLYDPAKEKVFYAGMSKDIGHRLYQHKIDGKFDRDRHWIVALIERDEKIRLLVEARILDLYMPSLNQRHQYSYWKKFTDVEKQAELERVWKKFTNNL